MKRYGKTLVEVCAGALTALDVAPMGAVATNVRVVNRVCGKFGYDRSIDAWSASHYKSYSQGPLSLR